MGGALGVAAYQLTLNEGAARTTAGITSLIIASCPAITLLLARMVGLERLTPARLGGIALAFAGIAGRRAVRTGPGQRAGRPDRSAVGARRVLVVGGVHDRDEAALAAGDSLAITAWSTLAGAACTLPFVRASTLDTIARLSSTRSRSCSGWRSRSRCRLPGVERGVRGLTLAGLGLPLPDHAALADRRGRAAG